MIGGSGDAPWSDPIHGGAAVTFNEVLSQTIAMLQQHGRVTYRALKRQFDLDDAFLEDVQEELLYARHLAVDEDGRVLVWTGAPQAPATPPVISAPPSTQARAPLAYTPPYLAEKILTSRSALEGE